jgi:predicted ester cyclase
VDPELVARRFFEEVWNARRLHVVDEIVAADCVTRQLRSADGPMPSASRGPEALKEHIASWLVAFPDLKWEVDAVVTERDRVVTWAVAHGTHQGSWLGIGPTGRRVAIRCVVLHRVVDGRIVEDWVVTEALGLFQQLGLVSDTPTLIARAAGS